MQPVIERRALVVDLKETAIATGSVCTSADIQPSHVIRAIVITAMDEEQRAHSSICISVGPAHDDEQVNEAVQRIAEAAKQLRAFAL